MLSELDSKHIYISYNFRTAGHDREEQKTLAQQTFSHDSSTSMECFAALYPAMPID